MESQDLSRRQRRALTQARNDAQHVAGNPAALRFIARILDMSGVNRTTYRTDPCDHAFAAGQAALGHTILDELVRADPDVHMKLLQTAARERAKSATETEEPNDETA